MSCFSFIYGFFSFFNKPSILIFLFFDLFQNRLIFRVIVLFLLRWREATKFKLIWSCLWLFWFFDFFRNRSSLNFPDLPFLSNVKLLRLSCDLFLRLENGGYFLSHGLSTDERFNIALGHYLIGICSEFELCRWLEMHAINVSYNVAMLIFG